MLDSTFSALSDSTRRSILARLNESGGLTVNEVAKPFTMSLPAVIKHLDVLTDAGLITRTRTGRTVTCRIRPEPMADAMAWLQAHLDFWNARLDALAALTEKRSDG
jgi:DNA-binding transcriptional ArsR family regulator